MEVWHDPDDEGRRPKRRWFIFKKWYINWDDILVKWWDRAIKRRK